MLFCCVNVCGCGAKLLSKVLCTGKEGDGWELKGFSGIQCKVGGGVGFREHKEGGRC